MHAAPTIGLLISSNQDVYENAILRGVFHVARQQGANAICFTSGALRSYHGFEAQRNVLYDLVNAGNVDGLIICGTLAHPVDPDEIRAFCQRYAPIPMVSIALSLPGISNVLVDSCQGIREVMEHLVVEHGYQRLAFICGPKGQQEADDRYHTYQQVLLEHGILYNPEWVADGDYTYGSGVRAMRELLLQSALNGSRIDFEAVVAANDSMALGAYETLKKEGFSIPEQVALTGFDDTQVGRFADPPLTTVRQSAFEQGCQATRLLFDQLSGDNSPSQVVASARMVVRRSCGCAGLRLPARLELASDPAPWPEALEHSLPETAVALQKMLSYIDPQIVASWAKSWLEAITADLNRCIPQGARLDLLIQTSRYLDEQVPRIVDNGALVQAVEAAHQQAAGLEIELAVWNRALAIFTRHTLFSLNQDRFAGQAVCEIAQRALQAAQRRLGEAAANAEARRQIEADRRVIALRESSEVLMTSFDLPSLLEVLQWELPRLGVSSAYLALFEDPQQPAGLARLVFAMHAGERLVLPEDGLVFPAQQLLPQEIWQVQSAFSLVVEALYSKEDRLGFAILEVAPEDAALCNSLRALLSGALQGVLLLDQRRKAVADLRHSQDELQAMVEQLEAANRELEAFAYSVSHDLRSPLRAIVGFSSILQQDYLQALPDDARQLVDRVIENGQRMSTLIDALLAFSRLGRTEMHLQPTDMNALVIQVCDSLMQEVHERQIEWIIHNLPATLADPALLRQVWVNLLGNAVKYTSRCPRARIEVGCQADQDPMVYYVVDNGAGFDMRYADKLFGVFQRLHRQDEYEGTGIGLANVARIINRHGGRVWAESAPGAGATFYFTLSA